MEIKRSQKMERMILDKIKAHLNRAPRSLDKWHVSDLLYPRKSYWQRKDPQPMTDLQALYFTAGRAHHEVVEAMLGPRHKWKYGDLMFLAGLIEGEGHFHVEADNGQVSIELDNTKKSLVDWCQSKFGGKVYHTRKATEKTLDVYRWHAPALLAEEVTKAIHPFLVSKRNQANICLELRDLLSAPKDRKNGQFTKLTKEEQAKRDSLVQQLKDSRKIDSSSEQLYKSSTDSGEFEKHGIYYSPDLRVPYPIEFKTSRSEYEPKNLAKGFEGYLKQLAKYQACMNEGRGGLLVFFLGLKDGFRKKPALHYYQVKMTEAELKEETENIKSVASALDKAVKTGKHDKLELCPAWMCKDCPWAEKCKPWLQDPKRAPMEVEDD